jgi:hypothetical protein
VLLLLLLRWVPSLPTLRTYAQRCAHGAGVRSHPQSVRPRARVIRATWQAARTRLRAPHNAASKAQQGATS